MAISAETSIIINSAALVIFLGVLSVIYAEKIRIPKMLPLILIGLVISFIPGIYLLQQSSISLQGDAETILLIAELALIIVLFNEGMHINVRHLMKNIAPILSLAVFGTILSIIFVAPIAFIIFPQEIKDSLTFLGFLLIVAIIVPTDPATTFSILRTSGIKIRKQIETILGGESAFNDVIAILLVVVVILPQVSAGNSTLNLEFNLIAIALWQLAGGILLGVILAAIALQFMLTMKKETNITAISMIIPLLLFSLSGLLGVSGAIGALIAGIFVKNPHLLKIRKTYPLAFFVPFWEKMTLLIEIFAFVLIGSLFIIDPPGQFGPLFILGTAIILTILVIGVRIIIVYISTAPLELVPKTAQILSNRERVFIAVSGFKGLTTAVLALLAYVTLSHSTEIQKVAPLLDDVLLSVSIALIIVSGIGQTLLLPKIAKFSRVTEVKPEV